MSRVPAHHGARRGSRGLFFVGLVATLLALACGPPVERFLPVPISLSYENGLVSFVGDVRGERDGRCGE